MKLFMLLKLFDPITLRFLTCDIDSGLGGKEQLRRTCIELRNLGVAAIQLERSNVR